MSKKQITSKRQELREKRRKKQRQQRLLVISGAAIVALVAAALLIIPSIQGANAPAAGIKVVTPFPNPNANFNAMGDPNAPVKMVEYSDFQCPYCRQFFEETEKQIIDNYVATGKVYFVYRSMGNWISQNLGKGGHESQDAAEAAYCAGDQGKFWEYHDMLFANWLGEGAGSFTKQRLTTIAEKLNLNMNEFSSCYDSQKYLSRVQQDYQDGIKASVSGTPSFVINGKLVEGALPFSSFQKEINAALASANSSNK